MTVAVVGALLMTVALAAPAAAVNPIDEHWTAGPAIPQSPWTTSVGVVSTPWPDGYCPPTQGDRSSEPTVAPDSYAKLLAQAALGRTFPEGVIKTTQDAMAVAWTAYVMSNPDHLPPPPPFTTIDAALIVVKSRIEDALTSQYTWESILERAGNPLKPARADEEQFLAHASEYMSGLTAAASCESADGSRLYRTGDGHAVFVLGPDGTWAKLMIPAEGPQIPAGPLDFIAVPGRPRTYFVAREVQHRVIGPDFYQIQGELALDPQADVHSCAIDEADLSNVNARLGATVYDTVTGLAGWFPAPELPKMPSFMATCASLGASYIPQVGGPVYGGPLQFSDGGTVAVGYTEIGSADVVARWTREGSVWSSAEPFANVTYNWGGDPEMPRLGVSADGSVVAGCWLYGPATGSRFPPLTDAAYHPPRFPEIFNFRTGQISYPRDGQTDPQRCGRVTLDAAGANMWWEQVDTTVDWFSSTTTPIMLIDLIPPVLSDPGEVAVEATGPAGALVTLPTVTATDDEDGAVPVTCSPLNGLASGDTFPLGVTTIRCRATDHAGNVGVLDYDVAVRDTTPPVLSPLDSLREEATGPDGATVTWIAAATDLVDGAVSPVCATAGGLQSGDTFRLGTSTVECTATDRAGNTANGTFLIDVVDTTPPLLAVPADFAVDASAPDGAAVSWDSSASDLVDGPVTPQCSPASGTVLPIGWTTVTCTAVDVHGNHAPQASFTVQVRSADEQLTRLTQMLPATGGLTDQVTAAQNALARGDRSAAKTLLIAFSKHVQAQADKSLSTQQADAAVSAATRVIHVIG